MYNFFLIIFYSFNFSSNTVVIVDIHNAPKHKGIIKNLFCWKFEHLKFGLLSNTPRLILSIILWQNLSNHDILPCYIILIYLVEQVKVPIYWTLLEPLIKWIAPSEMWNKCMSSSISKPPLSSKKGEYSCTKILHTLPCEVSTKPVLDRSSKYPGFSPKVSIQAKKKCHEIFISWCILIHGLSLVKFFMVLNCWVVYHHPNPFLYLFCQPIPQSASTLTFMSKFMAWEDAHLS